MKDKLIYFGDEIKAVGSTVKGYLVRFGKEGDTDLEGDYFTSETDFGRPMKEGQKVALNLYYHHGQDSVIGTKSIGTGFLKMDQYGLWYEAQLQMNDEYNKMILELAKRGKLGFSSGAAAHMVERKSKGNSNQITRWTLAEASLTPRPAESRNMAVVKSVDELKEEKYSFLNPSDRTTEPLAETKPYYNEEGEYVPQKPYEKDGEEEMEEPIDPSNIFGGIQGEMLIDSIECLNERMLEAIKLYVESPSSVNLDDLFMKYAEIGLMTVEHFTMMGLDVEKEVDRYYKLIPHKPIDVRDAEKTLREAMLLSRSESKKLASILWHNLCEAKDVEEKEVEAVDNSEETKKLKEMLLKKAMLQLL